MVKLSGFENHFVLFAGLMANGLSMSITVARFINSIARAEYAVCERANNRKRPRLIIGAASVPAVANAARLSSSRRVKRFLFSILECSQC